jgi:hypothetical protein
MQKNLNIILALIVVVLLSMQLFKCGGDSDLVADYEKKLQISQLKVDSLYLKIKSEKDTIEKIILKQDTIIQNRIVYRGQSSKEIEAAKSVSEVEADSLLNDRFETKVDNWVFTKIADSIALELNSVEKLYILEQQKSFSLSITNDIQSLIIIEKDEQISLNKNKFDYQLKTEKKKKFRAFGWGVVVGVGLAGTAIILLN